MVFRKNIFIAQILYDNLDPSQDDFIAMLLTVR